MAPPSYSRAAGTGSTRWLERRILVHACRVERGKLRRRARDVDELGADDVLADQMRSRNERTAAASGAFGASSTNLRR
jgi:hypothetical protein